MVTLSEYITRIGDDVAARRFGVRRRTVESWRRGERVPRPGKAEEIVRETAGEVSFEGCYQRDGTPVEPEREVAIGDG